MSPELMKPDHPAQSVPFGQDEPHPAYQETLCDHDGCGESGYVDYRVLDYDIETYCNRHYDPNQ